MHADQSRTIADRMIVGFMMSKIQSLVEEIADIRWDNQLAHNQSAHGFTYMGKVYLSPGTPPKMASKLPLHESLHQRMETYLAAQLKLDSEKTKIRQCMQAVLRPCNTLQDARDNLPEHLVEKVYELIGYPRTREPMYALQGNDVGKKALDRMLFILDYHYIQKLFI